MLVSSIGYFKNSADNIRKADFNQVQVQQQVAIRGLSKSNSADRKQNIVSFIKSLFNKESKLKNRAINMIG